MKLPLTRTQRAALTWLNERGGFGRFHDGKVAARAVFAPMKAETWRKLAAKGFVTITDITISVAPIDPELQLAESDVEETVIAARATAERFSHVKR